MNTHTWDPLLGRIRSKWDTTGFTHEQARREWESGADMGRAYFVEACRAAKRHVRMLDAALSLGMREPRK